MNKYTAVAPDGTILKRTTQRRVYTHMVAVLPNYTHAMNVAMIVRNQDRENFVYWERLVRMDEFAAYDTAETRQTVIDRVTVYMRAKNDWVPDAAQMYADDQACDRLARVNKANAQGYYDTYGTMSWCGRRELAEKVAARERQNPCYTEAKVIKVRVKK